MISISNAFRELLKSGDRSYSNIIIITLTSGTVLTLDHEKILIGGIDKDNSVSEDNSFSALGSAIINSLSVTIDNRTDEYTQYDFKDARVQYKIEKVIGSVIESKFLGTYTVDNASYNGFSVVLECLDYMEKFDRPYESGLNYPNSALNVLDEACTRCGVALNKLRQGFPSFSDNIMRKASGDATTYRDVIASIAQMNGYFAYCTVDGKLDFGWFDRGYLEDLTEEIDGNTFDPDDVDLTKAHYIESLYSQDISVDEVIITGIAINVKNEEDESIVTTYSRGLDDYVVELNDNLFITDNNAETIADRLAPILINLRFRKCNITHTNDFTMEAGDIAIIKDRKDNYYPILITRTNFKVGAQQSTVSAAETPSRNLSRIYSQYTKNIVKTNSMLSREKSQREVQYQELVDALADANGLYMSTEPSPGGGTVYYLHDKENLEDSDIVWKMTSDAFAVSTDGGQTWNAGLTVDGALIVKILSATGVNADWINAGAITVTDKNGQTIFEVSIDQNRVVIRDSAVVIGDMTLPDKLDQLLSDISWQADTKVETWYQPSTDDPSLTWDQRTSNLIDHNNEDILDHTNEPILLLSDINKRDHTGDLWHQTDTNKDYIYQNGQWMLQDVSNTVYDLIGEKATIFQNVTHPDPPYDVNDLWFTGSDIKVCVQERLEDESYVEADWEKKDYYYKEMTPFETWQHLTDNGDKQGLEYDRTTGQLYINGEYIRANTLDGDIIIANSINASKLNIGEGVNLYPNYDTFNQITTDKLAWRIIGIETTGDDTYKLTPSSRINGYFLSMQATSGSGNHYMLFGNSENYYGTIRASFTYYRISFYAGSSSSGAQIKPWVVEYENRPTTEPTQGTYTLNSSLPTFNLTSSYVRYEVTYRPTNNSVQYIGLGFACPVAGTRLQVFGIMIERLNTLDATVAASRSTSPFEPASITMIDGGNIMANTIKAKQIGVLGGWTIEENRMYHGNMVLNGAGEKLEFNAYTNPHGNPTRNKAYIDNAGNCSFYGINGDSLQIGGEYLASDATKLPSIYADDTSCGFYKAVNLLNATQINIGSEAPFVGPLKLSTYAYGSTFPLYVRNDGLVQAGSTPVSSSKRYKNHVRELTEEDGDLVYKLNPVWFKYKDEFLPEDSEIKGQALTGFYAEDILQIMPNVVYYNKEGLVENWKERELIPYLVKTIQNQKKKIDDLEKRLERLEKLLLKED